MKLKQKINIAGVCVSILALILTNNLLNIQQAQASYPMRITDTDMSGITFVANDFPNGAYPTAVFTQGSVSEFGISGFFAAGTATVNCDLLEWTTDNNTTVLQGTSNIEPDNIMVQVYNSATPGQGQEVYGQELPYFQLPGFMSIQQGGSDVLCGTGVFDRGPGHEYIQSTYRLEATIPVSNLPVGNYRIVLQVNGTYECSKPFDPTHWDNSGCTSSEVTSLGRSTTFDPAYGGMKFTITPPGAVVVNSNKPTCWHLTGPNPHNDCGTTQTYDGSAPGSYSITADNVSGFSGPTITPDPPQTLSANGILTFNLIYGGLTGTIVVNSNMNTSWGITGPANYNGSGTTHTYNSAPIGVYNISAPDIDGYGKTIYITPLNSTLTDGGTLTFNIVYTHNPAGTVRVYTEPTGLPVSFVLFDAPTRGDVYKKTVTNVSDWTDVVDPGTYWAENFPQTVTYNGRTYRFSLLTPHLSQYAPGTGVADATAGTQSEIKATYEESPAPTVTINATQGALSGSQITIDSDTSATINWSSTNADLCTVTPGNWAGTTNSHTTGNLVDVTTYTATCTGSGGFASATATVYINKTVTFDINYTPHTITPPVVTAVDNGVCSKLTINWTYSGTVTSFKVFRSTLQGSGFVDVSGNLSAATRSYQDDPPADNQNYYYIVRVTNAFGAGDSTAFGPTNVMKCVAILSASSKLLVQVNGVAFDQNTTPIKNTDTLSFQIIIRNTGNAPATINYICDTPSDNIGNIKQLSVSGSGSHTNNDIKQNQPGCAGGYKFNVTGVKQPDANTWIVSYNSTYFSPENTKTMDTLRNSAVINFTDSEGTKDSTVNWGPLLIKGSGGKPPIIEEIP